MSAACRATRGFTELLIQREAGESYDKARFDAEMDQAVAMWSTKQKEAGIDIGNDGEQQRVGFQTYMPQRMSGFGGESKRRRGKEFEEFPELVSDLDAPLSACAPSSRTRRRRRREMHYHDTSADRATRSRASSASPAKASRSPSSS